MATSPSRRPDAMAANTAIAQAAPQLAGYAALRGRLPGAALPWLGAAREGNIERFAAAGFPSHRLEAWKFTRLSGLADAAPAEGAPEPSTLPAFESIPTAHRLVFVNGRFRGDLSDLGHLPGNVAVIDLAQALAGDDAGWLEPFLAEPFEDRARSLAALNGARADHGLAIRLGAGAVIDPVHIVFAADASAGSFALHPRTVIVAEDGASASVLISHVGRGDGAYWSNPVVQARVGQHAVLRLYKHQDEGAVAHHTAFTSVDLAGHGCFHAATLGLGGQLARDEIAVRLGGPDAECRLGAASLARGRQLLDATWRLSHDHRGGNSSQLFKSVADDMGHVVFQGAVNVAVDAQKTDAQQLCRHLLLSDQAAADTKPELEILADDVKCSHGATIGDLDPASLFYFQARGIGIDQARALLVAAHLREPLDQIEAEPIRNFLLAALGRALGHQVEDASA
ncbi:MAG: SufD family Fe-S cluster assembly protein [Alphaproteobacteria bacterium]|nr:SufD family Fe-S cluster assembly protein [Alphaproteobacteria bacterium]